MNEQVVQIDNRSTSDNWIVNSTRINITVACNQAQAGQFSINLQPGQRQRVARRIQAQPYPFGQQKYDQFQYQMDGSETWEVLLYSGKLVMQKKDKEISMSKCFICDRSISRGSKDHLLYSAKKIDNHSVIKGNREETTTFYSSFAKHDFLTCRWCNLKNFFIAFMTLPFAVLWLFTLLAPLAKIDFLIPWRLIDLEFNFWTFLMGMFWWVGLVCCGTAQIVRKGFTWRKRKIYKNIFKSRDIKSADRNDYKIFLPREYQLLKPHYGSEFLI